MIFSKRKNFGDFKKNQFRWNECKIECDYKKVMFHGIVRKIN